MVLDIWDMLDWRHERIASCGDKMGHVLSSLDGMFIV
jgi:hypothetical protein